MNCVSVSGHALKKGITQFLQVTHGVMSQQTRNTFILKRRKEPPLHRKGSRPPNMRSRHFVYDLLEDTDNRKQPPLNLILTTYVEGVGKRGDKLSIAPFKAYTKFLLPGLAVYDTPENITKYADSEGDAESVQWSSHFVSRTINVLRSTVICIIMSNDNPWTLEPWHVKTAFRKAGIHMSEHCITMPPHEISGPNHDIENREFYVTITINGKETTPVRCRIHHYTTDVQAKKALPVNVNFWKEMAEPIFPEDKAVLDTLPIPFKILRARENEVQLPEDF